MRIFDNVAALIQDAKMATAGGSVKGCERTAMERFGAGGMALLPWTKQMLTVLWEQLRLLVQVIYYTFMSGRNTESKTSYFVRLVVFVLNVLN